MKSDRVRWGLPDAHCVAVVNGYQNRTLEDRKAEQGRILEMIKTGEPDSVAGNLQFLVDTGFLSGFEQRSKISAYLRKPSQHQLDDMMLLAHIRSQFKLSQETYGSPRMHAELCDDGVCVGKHRVARLMRDNGIKALQKRRYKKTTDSNHGGLAAPNLLDQDFGCAGPDRKWGVDISYIWTREGWLYLAIVLDLYSRRIVGWQTSDRLKKDLAITALKRAIVTRQPPPGLIHHSDRGSQYCSYEYRDMLTKHGILASMSGKGNCYDNSMVETVFKTIKNELVWPTTFQTRQEATNALAQYIDGFYNPVRRHSALGYKSPIKFEVKMAEIE